MCHAFIGARLCFNQEIVCIVFTVSPVAQQRQRRAIGIGGLASVVGAASQLLGALL
jgi:hypothetical protein